MTRISWWKLLCIALLLYTCSAGFLVKVPAPPGVPLQETIRNLFFHVPMWIGMMVLYLVSIVYAIRYLRNPNATDDIYSAEFARGGTFLGVLGLITGMIWANAQWGKAWSGDAKQNGAAIAVLIYFAYFVLRGSLQDEEKKARVGAVYNIFAFFMLFPTIWILPRLTESLHPGGQGSEGNPGLNPKDSTPAMRSVMYPAFIGWTLLGVWITTLRIRVQIIQQKRLANG
ncbi:cytochrome c biogenesis protein CcsA [Sediminibacterium ginsengisoli]|uniref:Heme exporter protein C n=1 Tax=Sediminibacterium ginsengisoli TaxID=413434 RepID=A0A1T4QDK9_9BACT|nr:cytochrome c biogenesis protein CcsA [Sediminibacterium ginsengisoli]SKA01900.1 heme exporter protein C [Sediminibacterium ginsengisoli]